MARFKVTHYDGTKSVHRSLDSAKKAAKKKLKDYMEPGDGLQVWSVNKKTVGMAVSSGGELTDEQSFIVQEDVGGLDNFRRILSEQRPSKLT